MIYQILSAAIGTVGFSFIFNVPRSELIYCGISGAVCWLFYQIVIATNGSTVVASFVATIVITMISRFFAFNRKMPLTIFLIAGILPLVPGAGIYYTMYDMLIESTGQGFVRGIETLKVAGVIAVGIIVVLSMPKQFFNFSVKKS